MAETSPDLDRLLRLREDGVSWQAVGEQVVVLDLTASRYLELNSSGALLFLRIADGATEGDLAALLQERYGLEEHQALDDTRAFVQHLEREKLLQG